MSAIPVLDSPFATVTRTGRHLLVRLNHPARVLSTSHVNGGQRRDLRWLVNHQSCEPVKHQERFEFITGLGQDGYHDHVCRELGIPPEETAVMGTAATMQYLGVVTHRLEDLSVTAIVTAGVTGNAGCAGDPAHFDERAGNWVRVTATEGGKPAGTQGGTINTVVLYSAPFTDSALARAVVTMTEAKSSALTELAIGSKTSWRPATGTGTDQYVIAAPLMEGPQRTWTGKHTKAGELTGLAVREATLEALRWQNGLEASYTRSILHCLGRYGLSEERLKAGLEPLLTQREYQLFKDNWNPVVHEPQLSAACYAFASVLDRVMAGTLGPSSAAECLVNQAALMAAGLAARPEAFPAFRSTLMPLLRLDPGVSPSSLAEPAIKLCLRALAAGWSAKWST